MARYLFDTNHLSAAIDDEAGIRGRILGARQAGHRLGTCVPVLCELEAGLRASARGDHYRNLLDRLLSGLRIWPIDPPVARIYGAPASRPADPR